MEDDDEPFFGQIQNVFNFTKEGFIVVTLSLEEKNPYIDLLGIEKYLFPNDKLDIDFGPSMEIKGF